LNSWACSRRQKDLQHRRSAAAGPTRRDKLTRPAIRRCWRGSGQRPATTKHARDRQQRLHRGRHQNADENQLGGGMARESGQPGSRDQADVATRRCLTTLQSKEPTGPRATKATIGSLGWRARQWPCLQCLAAIGLTATDQGEAMNAPRGPARETLESPLAAPWPRSTGGGGCGQAPHRLVAVDQFPGSSRSKSRWP